ncbi:MAG: CHAT domain-containing protein [Bradymonadia bacterium]
MRWLVRWVSDPPPARQKAARLSRASAREALKALGSMTPEDSVWATPFKARLKTSLEGPRAGVEAWLEGARLAGTHGVLSEQMRNLHIAAHMAVGAQMFSEASEVLAQARDLNVFDIQPRSRWDNQHAQSYLHAQLGQWMLSRRALEGALAGYREAGLSNEAASAGNSLALLLSDLGHHRIALEVLKGEVDPDALPTHLQLLRNVNLGWILLRGATERMWPLDEARLTSLFTGALAYAQEAHGDLDVANIRANLALTAILANNLAEAETHLTAAEAADPRGESFAALFIARLKGELALAKGDAQQALEIFAVAELLARRKANGDCEDCWRGAWGSGRAALALGNRQHALEIFRRAIDEMDRLAQFASVTEDRGRFRADRRDLVDDTLRLLLHDACGAKGPCLDEAFALADARRAAPLDDLLSRLQADHLSATEAQHRRARIDAARQAQRELRTLVERGAVVPESEQAQWQAAHVQAKAARDAAFEDAFAFAGPASGDPQQHSPHSIRQHLGDDAALLLITPLDEGWYSFWLDNTVLRGAAITDDPLAPWTDALKDIRHLYVVPGGHPKGLAIATDALGDRPPLLKSHTVAVLPHGGLLNEKAATASGPPVIIADPRGDLSGAAEEGRQLATRWPDAQVLSGPRARTAPVLDHLTQARRVHFAGHGVLHRADPWAAHLALFDTDTLDVYAILTHPVPSELVFLSGCETGVDDVILDEEIVGLPEAFLAAGARSVVATARPVADRSARAFARHFYDHLDAGPAAALRAAALALEAEGDPHWTAYRLMGRR